MVEENVWQSVLNAVEKLLLQEKAGKWLDVLIKLVRGQSWK